MFYDPYGAPTVLGATWGTPSGDYSWIYLHQGGRYDAISGLYHFRNREYSPTLARWMQNDPLRFDAGDSNLYRYVFNSPTNRGDAAGLGVHVTSLTITNKGAGVNNIPTTLGAINTEDKFAYGFKVRVETSVDGGDDITKGCYGQDIWSLTWAQGNSGKWYSQLHDVDGGPRDITDDQANKAWELWKKTSFGSLGDLPYGYDVGNKELFGGQAPWANHGKIGPGMEFVEWSDAVGYYEHPLPASAPPAVGAKLASVRFAVEIAVIGTDLNGKLAYFWRRLRGKSDGVKWVVVEDAGEPQLPIER
jgi:RHS repeat-associated protein